MEQPPADLPDVAADVTVQPPDLTGGEDRFSISALRLHREARTQYCSECSITTTPCGEANAKHPRTAWEIQQWSDYQDRRGPDSDAETLAFFANYVGKLTKTSEDIKTWADLLDLDDYVTFGGKA